MKKPTTKPILAVFAILALAALLLAACTTPPSGGGSNAPAIGSFSADPASLPAGGGATTLSWNVSGADSLAIDQGVGDVTGSSSTDVNVAETTTFTLTASNDEGQVTATTTVTVADGGGGGSDYGGVVFVEHTPDGGGAIQSQAANTDLSGFFFELAPPFTEEALGNPTADRVDVCVVIDSSDFEIPDPFEPGDTFATLDVGSAITFSSGGGTYATAPKSSFGSLTFYATASSLTSTPPDDLTFALPGGSGFPALSGVPVPDVEAFDIAASDDFSAITPTTTFSWTPSGGTGSLVTIAASQFDFGSGSFLGFSCTAADDGTFALPASVQSDLADIGFISGILDTAARESYHVESGTEATVLVITEVHDPDIFPAP